MWVSLTEPGRKSTRVASTDDEHLAGLIRVHISNEIGQVSKSLLRVEIAEVIELPRVKWLRITVETMLEDHKSSFMSGTDHEWEESRVRDTASVLTTNVDKDGS